jgi:hypothetical protein
MTRSALRRVLGALLAALSVTLLSSAVSADPVDVSCELVPALPGSSKDVDLSGRFVANVGVEAPYELTAHLLVLDRDGEPIQEIPIDNGDTFQIAIRDQVKIDEHPNGPFDWLVRAPGVLYRVQVRKDFVSELAYCGPYAAIRVDQPRDTVFVKTVVSPLGDVHLTVGMAQMKPESIQVEVDCVDILAAAGASFPGGPFSGTAMIANTQVGISDLIGNFDRGTISFTLSGLPGGTHLVRVAGIPVYIDELPPGHEHWKRPLGVLEHEQEIHVFTTEISSPSDGAILPFSPTEVTGTIAHGLPVDSLRVYGMLVPLPPAVLVPGDGCVGDSLHVDFTATLPPASLGQDFLSGDDLLSALDPGANYIMALAADELGHVSNDRVYVALGNVQTQGNQLMTLSNGGSCEPTPTAPDHVTNGFAVSLSEHALSSTLSARFLPLVRSQVSAQLDALVGQTLSALADPCSGTSPEPPDPPPMAGPPPGPDAPVWTPIGDQTVNVVDTLKIALSATSPKNEMVSFSGDTLPDNAKVGDDNGTPTFFFSPSCTQIGGPHPVALAAQDQSFNQSIETFNVTVSPPENDLEIDGTITKVEFDDNNFSIGATLPSENEIKMTVHTGPIKIFVEADKCLGDCGLLCCIEIELKVHIELSDVVVGVKLEPEQALCGIAEGEVLPVEASVGDINVEIPPGGVIVGGLFGWLNPESLANRVIEFFGMQNILVEAIAEPHLKGPIRDSIENAVKNNFPTDLVALQTLDFNPDLPPEIPMTLDTVLSNIAVVEPHTAISTGVHSQFEADPEEDPTPMWQETHSSFPHAGIVGADMMIGVSDDALDQMAAALVATGTLRNSFEGLTIGSVSALLALPDLGLPADTPLVLTIDAVQVADTRPIPPIIAFVDDPATQEVLEVIARVQMAVRGVLPRGNLSIGDDRNLCACIDLTPGCQGQPCVIYESVLKLNLLTDVTLTEAPGPSATLNFNVTEVQQLIRKEGFDSYEAMDYQLDEAQIVETSATSPLLELLRMTLNQRIAPFEVPSEALTLDGFVAPANLRLFSATVDAAGHGDQDYAGIIADVP